MTKSEKILWQKLERFTIGRKDVALDFTARLARENRWSQDFSARVVLEYKRFVFLAIHAGHSVTPSEEVDRAWHLHLVYSASYWKEMCAELLEQELHHYPTEGGLAHGERFFRQYEHTLESYQRLFGEEAPADIWPPASERFRANGDRWVDTRKYWLFPKPTFLKKLVRPSVVTTLLLLLTVLGSTACRSESGVLNLKGETFLILYTVLLIGAGLLSILLSKWMWTEGKSSKLNLSNPMEIACLGGGIQRSFCAALGGLVGKKLVSVGRDQMNWPSLERLPAGDAEVRVEGLERVIYHSMPEGRVGIAELRISVEPALVGLRDQLIGGGLLQSKRQRIKSAIISSLPLLALSIFGLSKVVIGLGRDKPVSYLIVLCIVAGVFGWYILISVPRRTKQGEAAWKNVKRNRRRECRALFKKGEFSFAHIDDPVYQDAEARRLGAGMPMAVAILGAEAFQLGKGDFRILDQAIGVEGRRSNGGDGGSDGGGCGGGGCGGCGGGD